jgi:hypothetical protein
VTAARRIPAVSLARDSDAGAAAALDGGRAGGSPAGYVAEVLAVLPSRVDGGGEAEGGPGGGESSLTSWPRSRSGGPFLGAVTAAGGHGVVWR